MDLGTILLIAAVAAGALDAIFLFLGPRLRSYESNSFITSVVSFLTALGAIVWLGFLIFTNQFQYDYVNDTTNIAAGPLLKLSALWAGQSGSLVFWTFLSFGLYFAFRVITRGYEDDKLVSRAAIIMVFESALIAVNALVANPFRITPGAIRPDGYGLNPLLSTIWNVIHPPIIFIGYALILVPFAIKLAGFTMRSEERNQDKIPVVESFSRLTTVASWIMLSAGIFIGGYWAYIVLGWGGYWAWDPVETTSLIPWLLITAFYHAKPTLNKNDVLRDSFLVMGYITVVFATWVTRSGVLSSVHGFGLSLVSWTMLITLLINLIIGVSFALYSGFRDMSDDDDDSIFGFFDIKNVRMFSIKMSLVGIIIVAATSTIGVALPAASNLGVAIFDPANLEDAMVGIDIEFFRIGFYASAVFLIASAFYCMRTSFLSNKKRSVVVILLFGVGGVLAVYSLMTGIPLPTLYWPANFLIPIAAGGIAFLAISFAQIMVGKSQVANTRQVGRMMLHLGLIVLLFGVFMSENVVYENNSGYQENTVHHIAPGISVRVADINLHHWNHDRDFHMIVRIEVIENNITIIGIGYADVRGHPGWGSITHQVYVHTNAMRDVFIAVTGFTTVATFPEVVYQVTVHTKILPFVSFVWLGPFLMISAMIPMFAIEIGSLRKSLRKKDEHLYEPEQSSVEIAEN
ncbi:MAG: cytochrome c biogenesis protein CcsA [Candidatus Thorarchaeota archaeon]|jgi:cytochrome c-type biogenesis protein CcmF